MFAVPENLKYEDHKQRHVDQLLATASAVPPGPFLDQRVSAECKGSLRVEKIYRDH
jgi:hypothetical protein